MRGRDGIVVAADTRAVGDLGIYTDGISKVRQVFKNCCVGYCGDDANWAMAPIDRAVKECGAEADALGDAGEFAESLSAAAQHALSERRAPDGNPPHVQYIVVGYTLRHDGVPDRAVLSILSRDDSWVPGDKVQGWFLKAGRWDLVPHFSSLLGKRNDDMSVSLLSKVAIMVLHQTARVLFTVAPPFELFVVTPNGFKRKPTARLVALAESAERAMGEALRTELRLPKRRDKGKAAS